MAVHVDDVVVVAWRGGARWEKEKRWLTLALGGRWQPLLFQIPFCRRPIDDQPTPQRPAIPQAGHH